WAIASARTLSDMAAPEELAMASRGGEVYAGEAGRTGERWPAANEPAPAAGRHWTTADTERERATGGPTTTGGMGGPPSGAYQTEEQARAAAEQARRQSSR
ncbi:MAG TPA: hypothetical protein VF163_23165, partial [Micromonosporaceae bacterium]